jgi:hypothetical protein
MTMRGVAEWMLAADGLVTGADLAVRKSVSQGAYAEKKLIRGNMTGAPRWIHGQNFPHGGGPGQITGKLMRSVTYTPIVKAGYGRYTTTIRAKRIYAARTEHRYPYFTPGHREAAPLQREIFVRNIAAALR